MLAAALLPASLSPAQELPARAQMRLEEGDALLEQGDWTGAIQHYEKANRLAKGRSFEVLLRLARTSFGLGQYKAAVDFASDARALTEVPSELAELTYLVGRSYFESAYLAGVEVEPEKVEEVWEASMKMAEGFLLNTAATAPGAWPDSRYFLGRIYEERRDLAAAERFYRDYLKLVPEGEHVGSASTRLRYLSSPHSDPLPVDGDMIPPVNIYSPQPQYTWEARKARIQGVVIVQVVIDRSGEVTQVKLLKGLPKGLDQAALAAIRRWRFKPAQLPDGRVVAVYYTLTINFRLGS